MFPCVGGDNTSYLATQCRPVPRRTYFHKGDRVTTFEKKVEICLTAKAKKDGGHVVGTFKKKTIGLVLSDAPYDAKFIHIKYGPFLNSEGYLHPKNPNEILSAQEYLWWNDQDDVLTVKKTRVPEIAAFESCKDIKAGQFYQTLYSAAAFSEKESPFKLCDLPVMAIVLLEEKYPEDGNGNSRLKLTLVGAPDEGKSREIKKFKLPGHDCNTVWVTASKNDEFLLVPMDERLKKETEDFTSHSHYLTGQPYRITKDEVELMKGDMGLAVKGALAIDTLIVICGRTHNDQRLLIRVPESDIIEEELHGYFIVDERTWDLRPVDEPVRPSARETYRATTVNDTSSELVYRIRLDQAEKVREILDERGHNAINQPASNGEYPLNIAIKFARTGIIDLFINMCENLDLEVSNRQGHTAIHHAVLLGIEETIDDALTDSSGRFTKYKSHLLAKLIDKGANLHARDVDGNTPLINAVRLLPPSAPNMVQILLEAKADAKATNTKEFAACDYLAAYLKEANQSPRIRNSVEATESEKIKDIFVKQNAYYEHKNLADLYGRETLRHADPARPSDYTRTIVSGTNDTSRETVMPYGNIPAVADDEDGTATVVSQASKKYPFQELSTAESVNGTIDMKMQKNAEDGTPSTMAAEDFPIMEVQERNQIATAAYITKEPQPSRLLSFFFSLSEDQTAWW